MRVDCRSQCRFAPAWALLFRCLDQIRVKLDLLGKQDDCPICLESLAAMEEKPHVLRCCHKVCAECWSHWADMPNGGSCPLCRNEDFLGNLYRANE